MEIKILNSYKELSLKVAGEVMNLVRNKPDSVLCFPAGHTPMGLYEILVEKSNKHEVDFSGCSFIGLDEWLGIDESDPGSCKHFMVEFLFGALGIKPGQIHFFNAMATDPDQECLRINAIVKHLGGIDLMILGIGMNGHLGLNEPGVDPALYAHITGLDPVTRRVGQKYFSKETSLTKGITLGIRQIMESKQVILMANGVKKAEIVKQILAGEISSQIPASFVRKHANAVFYMDQEAAHQ